jgi:hypothetical protein
VFPLLDSRPFLLKFSKAGKPPAVREGNIPQTRKSFCECKLYNPGVKTSSQTAFGAIGGKPYNPVMMLDPQICKVTDCAVLGFGASPYHSITKPQIESITPAA